MAYTFKNIRGTELTGTNTLFEKAEVPEPAPGGCCTVTFTQKMDPAGWGISSVLWLYRL